MKKAGVLSILFVVILLAVAGIAEAQQLKKVSRIGYLSPGSLASSAHLLDAFRQGLRELGYIEGKNILIEYRFAEGKADRLSELAAELVRLKVDVILVANNTVARAALSATKTIPIVLASGNDPVVSGLVESLARPGGNVTGLTNLTVDLGVKRLELLKEIIPRLTRVAVLPSPGGAGQSLKELQTTAPSLRLQLHIMEVRSADDLPKAFETATKAGADALIVTLDPTGLFAANQKQIIELAIKSRLPGMYPSTRDANSGGLLSYAANEIEMYRRTAWYVDRILKGAKPADLPVEQPTKFELVINLRTAKQIGLTIPPNVLARADRVIR